MDRGKKEKKALFGAIGGRMASRDEAALFNFSRGGFSMSFL
jgi:hypothetical protein